MELITTVAVFFGIVGLCLILDWHCRGLADRRLRKRLHSDVESYLKGSKRI